MGSRCRNHFLSGIVEGISGIPLEPRFNGGAQRSRRLLRVGTSRRSLFLIFFTPCRRRRRTAGVEAQAPDLLLSEIKILYSSINALLNNLSNPNSAFLLSISFPSVKFQFKSIELNTNSSFPPSFLLFIHSSSIT